MGLFKNLTEKPWLPRDDSVVELHPGYFNAHNRRVALVVFLCVVGVVFFLLFVATHMRMNMSTDWVPAPEPPLLWANSAVLVLVSVCFEWTRRAVALRDVADSYKRFLWAGALTALFLVGQLVVWKQFYDLGYGHADNPANSFFYIITAVHGVHLLGGLVAWVRALPRLRQADDLSAIRLSVDLCALYWHFLLFVWVAMLALFVST